MHNTGLRIGNAQSLHLLLGAQQFGLHLERVPFNSIRITEITYPSSIWRIAAELDKDSAR
jgi:hypothetical protein